MSIYRVLHYWELKGTREILVVKTCDTRLTNTGQYHSSKLYIGFFLGYSINLILYSESEKSNKVICCKK